MAAQVQEDTPYDITTRIWRDEQPGDEPTLNFSAVFVPTGRAAVWSEPRVQRIQLEENGRRRTPRTSELMPLGDGGFELKASFDATPPAAARATATITVQTAAGPRHVTLADIEIARID